jgi:integrative and conjugative element protein (TIGR02256 family)
VTLLFQSNDRRFAVELAQSRMAELRRHCKRAGLNETGGILAGRYSTDGESAVVTQIGAPPNDSRAGTTWFERGSEGLRAWLRALWRDRTRTYYLGEWHFHPGGAAKPSHHDFEQMRVISTSPAYRCPEPILAIVGGDAMDNWELALFVVTCDEQVRLLRKSPR